MAFYLWTGNYTRDALRAMIAKPQDREVAAREVVESAGGKLHHIFISLGASDIVILCEFPDDVSMAAVGLVTRAAGAVTNSATTRLLTMSEFSEAMVKADKIRGAYKPPQQ